jgi:hypothetical protein
MDTNQHNPARLYNCDETGITVVQHKHTKILGLKRQASDIFSSIRRTGISCDSRHLYGPNWTLHSSVTCISKKKYETRTYEWHATWINPRVPSLRVDTQRDFFPVVSSSHQTHKAYKRRSCYLSTGRALFTHQERGSHYFISRE